jgi:hypothetical protein
MLVASHTPPARPAVAPDAMFDVTVPADSHTVRVKVYRERRGRYVVSRPGEQYHGLGNGLVAVVSFLGDGPSPGG